MTEIIWNLSNGGARLFPFLAASAIIDSVNPCAFSILLLTIAFLFSAGHLRSKILTVGGFYIAGIFLVYLAIGLGLLQVLHLFNTPHFIAKIGAAFLIILGVINIINWFFPKFPIKFKIPNAAHHKMSALIEKSSLPAAFLLGALVGLCEFPCTGGPYLAAVGLLNDKATYLAGVGYLLAYNIIFILPLAAALLLASNKNLLERVRTWQEREKSAEKVWAGLAMVILGIIIYLL